jgi:RNA polymerase-binding transcription factor DksA
MSDRWQVDPIRGLRTDNLKGSWKARVAKLNHLKKVHLELAGDEAGTGIMKDIDIALERIEAGSYNLCVKCSRTVEEDIIRQSCPWITACKDCR